MSAQSGRKKRQDKRVACFSANTPFPSRYSRSRGPKNGPRKRVPTPFRPIAQSGAENRGQRCRTVVRLFPRWCRVVCARPLVDHIVARHCANRRLELSLRCLVTPASTTPCRPSFGPYTFVSASSHLPIQLACALPVLGCWWDVLPSHGDGGGGGHAQVVIADDWENEKRGRRGGCWNRRRGIFHSSRSDSGSRPNG